MRKLQLTITVLVVTLITGSVTLHADRVKLRSGKTFSGTFLGGDATMVRMKLDDKQLMLDVEAAAAHLKGKKLGIVGYCFGGTVAWWGATRSHSFAAASCWYGGGIAGTKEEKPNCPVQMHFGELDTHIPMSDVETMRRKQPQAEVHVYPGAGHGFHCDERGS